MEYVFIDQPNGRRRNEDDMLPLPSEYKDQKSFLESRTNNLVSLVCADGDVARLEHEQWLLEGDWHVSSHQFVRVDNCIFSIAVVEW